MQPNDNGDGTGLGPTGEAPLVAAPPIEGERSSNAEELNAKIEAELGLPHTEVIPNADTQPENNEGTDGKLDGDKPDDTGGSDEAKPADPEDTKPQETKPAPVISDEDLFIEVEDAEGKVHKITKIEDLPEDFEAKNNRQGYEILHQLGKLEAKIEAHDAAQAEADRSAADTAAQQEQFDAWDNEIASLAKEKRIDASDQTRISKVFEHIGEINAARVKANNPNLITSFEDGLDKYEKVEAKAQADDKLKQENDRAKLKSSMIGGGSTAAGGAAQPYYSGRYRSMEDVPV